jgi:hypothetical protein
MSKTTIVGMMRAALTLAAVGLREGHEPVSERIGHETPRVRKIAGRHVLISARKERCLYRKNRNAKRKWLDRNWRTIPPVRA